MAVRTCALGVCSLLLLVTAVTAESRNRWSRPLQGEFESRRSDWVPVSTPFRDTEPAASAQHEEVATVLRPPEFASIRQQRLAQTPRQGRGPTPQQYFPGDQTHLIRFPNEPSPQLRAPSAQQLIFQQQQQNFQNQHQQPIFLQPQPVPQGFPPTALTQQSFQPQPIPVFNSQPTSVPVRQLNNSFINADPQDEVQLVYVPVEALQAQKGQSGVPKKQVQTLKPTKNSDEAFQEQLRQFVQHQPPSQAPVLSAQQHQQNQFEQQRFAQIREQEERRRIQELELKERQEQENRLRKDQDIRERQEQELRQKQAKEAKQRQEEEDRARQEANVRYQQQQQQDFQRRPTPTPGLQAQEQVFQQHLQSQHTPEPTGPAPHQPPLAVYMGSSGRNPVVIDDVLSALRNAHTIPVLDRVPDEANPPPQVFVGPAEMTPPEGYTKFELPYLSSLESNRVERKVEQLPFFVAPLSFQPPHGYSKIPFPSPHVGSVVVSHGGRHLSNAGVRPLSPDPEVLPEEYAPSELPSISPAIPLLVNSLQSGRGAKHQRPHVEQQFVQQGQFEEEQPALTEVPELPPTVASPTFSRRPLNSRGRTRQQSDTSVERTTPASRTRTPVRATTPDSPISESRPTPTRGRRPGGRTRVTTTPEPIADEEFDSTHESNVEQQQQEQPDALQFQASPSPPQFTAPESATLHNQPQNFPEQPPFHHQSFDPQAFPAYQGPFQGFHAPPVHPSQQTYPQFEQPQHGVPANHATHTRGHFVTPAPTQIYQQVEEEKFEQTEIDASAIENQRFEAPKKVGSTRTRDGPRSRPRQPEVPSFAEVSTVEPTFQRRPNVFQPIVSSTPESLLPRQSPTPYVTTPAYPTEIPQITPHHVAKGEVGRVQQQVNFPFIPTPLPELPAHVSEHSQVSSTAQPAFEPHHFSIDDSIAETPAPTVQPVSEEVQFVASPSPTPLSYQTPSRTRTRVTQENAETPETHEPTHVTPRPRVRAQTESVEQTPNYQSSQRFRGRGQTSKEEGVDESTSQQPATRVRGRVQTARGRGTHTTESPGLQITVPDIPRRQPVSSDAADTTSTRTRSRFRTTERARGPGARQQQVTRGRQPARQQDSESLELAKPVRQQIGTTTSTPVDNESPVYVPEVQFESGFVPALDSQKALPTSTSEASAVVEVTTLKPTRGRFNNFATGTRGTQRGRLARPTTATSQEGASVTPTAAPGRAYTVRSGRRPQTTPQPAARVTSIRGGRIRRPTTTTEAPEEEPEVIEEPTRTGVTYVHHTIHRPIEAISPHAASNEVQSEDIQEEVIKTHPQPALQAVPATRFRQRPQPEEDEGSYVEPATRYNSNPVEPEYQQYYSPTPLSRNQQQQEQYFTASTLNPQQPIKQLFASRSTTAPEALEQYHREVEPQQYHREEYEYQPQQATRQHRPRNNNPGRYVELSDPEYGGQESQRSEQISIQQLEGAIAASLFSKPIDNVEIIEEEPEGAVELGEELEQNEENVSEQNIAEEKQPASEQQTEEEEQSTEENIAETEQDETTEEPMTTVSGDEEVSQSTSQSTESTHDKPALHAKSSEGRRRRVRVRTRKQRPGDVFETAESQNVATINLLNQPLVPEKQMIRSNEWKLALPNYPTLDISSEEESEENNNRQHSYEDDSVDLINFTTESSESDLTVQPEETTDESLAESTTDSVDDVDETTSQQAEVTSTTTPAPGTVTEPMSTADVTEHSFSTQQQAETTTDLPTTTEVAPPSTPRVLGTSTTTEISLETEICYRGRCVKTKVDADQIPIE